MNRNRWISFLALTLSLGLTAADFALPELRQAAHPTFDLSQVAKTTSFYDFMRSRLGTKIQELAPSAKPSRTNQAELEAGHGVSVKLSERNYNVHINFPNAATGGRSYGWTSGKVGDWSDAMYLDHLAGIVGSDDANLAKFYQWLVEVLGACNADDSSLSVESLNAASQRVATNFLAIYTAEAYRAMVPQPHLNWDDALFEVTMLGAFHGGQSTFTKFYLGKFSTESKKQGAGVYAKTRPGPSAGKAADKHAEMNDYWQFSANPTSRQSGINETRVDFEKLGTAITKYESRVAHNPTLGRIQAVVGGESRTNVIKGVARFFTNGRSKDLSKIDSLAQDVSDFLMDVRSDADKITAWELHGER
jgi:hypothetical protein